MVAIYTGNVLHKFLPPWRFCLPTQNDPRAQGLSPSESNNGWVLICSLQNCIFLLGDSSEVTHRITSKFCDDKKDTLLYIMSNFQLNSLDET